jgi:hypothetical protein
MRVFPKPENFSELAIIPAPRMGKELEMIPDGAFFEANPSRSYRLRPGTPEEIASAGPFDDGLTAYIVAARWSDDESFKSILFTWRENRHGSLTSELDDEIAAKNAWNNLRVPPPMPRAHRRSGRPPRRQSGTVAAGPIQL